MTAFRPNDDVNPTGFVITCPCGTTYTVPTHKLAGARCPNCSTPVALERVRRTPRRRQRRR